MKAQELRILSDEELRDRVSDLREEIGRLRFRSGSEEMKNTAQIRTMRREIARINTVLSERTRSVTVGSVQGSSEKGGEDNA